MPVENRFLLLVVATCVRTVRSSSSVEISLVRNKEEGGAVVWMIETASYSCRLDDSHEFSCDVVAHRVIVGGVLFGQFTASWGQSCCSERWRRVFLSCDEYMYYKNNPSSSPPFLGFGCVRSDLQLLPTHTSYDTYPPFRSQVRIYSYFADSRYVDTLNTYSRTYRRHTKMDVSRKTPPLR